MTALIHPNTTEKAVAPPPHSQLAEAVQRCESATGVLDCARNLIVVQIPGEETQKA